MKRLMVIFGIGLCLLVGASAGLVLFPKEVGAHTVAAVVGNRLGASAARNQAVAVASHARVAATNAQVSTRSARSRAGAGRHTARSSSTARARTYAGTARATMHMGVTETYAMTSRTTAFNRYGTTSRTGYGVRYTGAGRSTTGHHCPGM